MNRSELILFPDTETLVQQVAGRWLDAVDTATTAKKPFHVALSGGRVAGRFMAAAHLLGSARGTCWDTVHFHWGDERCVPPDHADSNYKLAQTALLDPAGIAIEQQHRLRGELPPDEAAHLAEVDFLPIFSPQSVAKYEQGTRDLCNALIDEFIDKGVADAASDYAQHIPVRVISKMLGVPLEMEPEFTEWVRGVLENMTDKELRM